MQFTFNNQQYYLKTDINDIEHPITLLDYCKILDIFRQRERNPEFDEQYKSIDLDNLKEDDKLKVLSSQQEEYIEVGNESEAFKMKRYEDLFLLLSNVPESVMKQMQEQFIDYNFTSVFQILMQSIKNITKDDSSNITKIQTKLFNIPDHSLKNRYYSYPDLDTISFEQWCNIETLGRSNSVNPNDTTTIAIAASLLTPIESLDVFDTNGQLIYFDSIQAKIEYFKTTDINRVNTKLKNATNTTNPFKSNSINSNLRLVSASPASSNLSLIDCIKNDIEFIRSSFKGLYSSSGGDKVGKNTQTYLEGVGWFDTIISLANNPSPIFNSPTGTLDAVKQRNALDVLNYLNIKKQKDDAEYKDWKVKNKI